MRVQLGTQGETKRLQLVKKTSFLAGNQKQTMKDRITQKREQARKQAMKLVRDQFDSDGKTDQTLVDGRNRMDELSSEMKERNSQIQELKAANEELRKEYGVAADSQEQSNLELMEKQMRVYSGQTGEELTEEEQKRLQEMGPATEYQQRVMSHYADMNRYTKENLESQKSIHAESATISEIKRENVKNDGMLKALSGADAIMQSASDEIIGMIRNEVKEKIDEEAAKVREEAKKKADEKAEEEKKLAEKKAEEKQAEGSDQKNIWNTTSNTTNIQELASLQEQGDQVQLEIQQILNQQSLLGEDIKGIGIDVVS